MLYFSHFVFSLPVIFLLCSCGFLWMKEWPCETMLQNCTVTIVQNDVKIPAGHTQSRLFTKTALVLGVSMDIRCHCCSANPLSPGGVLQISPYAQDRYIPESQRREHKWLYFYSVPKIDTTAASQNPFSDSFEQNFLVHFQAVVAKA